MKARLVTLGLLALGTSTSLLVACGGASSPKYTGPTAGPTAILNGPSTSSATSYWSSANCFLKVELGADGTFIGDVNTDGTWTMTPGNWTASGSSSAGTTGNTVWIDALTSIEGSTYSGSFSVTSVGVYALTNRT
jgi:hypothetical protein